MQIIGMALHWDFDAAPTKPRIDLALTLSQRILRLVRFRLTTPKEERILANHGEAKVSNSSGDDTSTYEQSLFIPTCHPIALSGCVCLPRCLY